MDQFKVLSHTHWDREWYETFQQYRSRLVRLMDNLIEILEDDSNGYDYFHLDGQTIVLEDYFEIRPENRERVKALIAGKKLIVGPWYVMPDEFLVSGESLTRNLRKGMAIAKSYDAEMIEGGYVTDIFGHNNQFPQILRQFGLRSAMMFRGLSDYPHDAFLWEGLDGSTVLAFRLCRDRAYSNFYFAARYPYDEHPYDKEDMLARVGKLMDRLKEEGTSQVHVFMDGVDHMDAGSNLYQMMCDINERFPDVHVEHSTYNQFVEAYRQSNPHPGTIKGNLYEIGHSGINNIIVKNVLSSLVELKQANDRLETKITLRAEAYDAYTHLLADRLNKNQNYLSDTRSFVSKAWEYLLKNHPHDSICGCSIGEVHMDNLYRFRQADDLCNVSIRDNRNLLCENINTQGTGKDGSFVVLNQSASEVNEVCVVEVRVPTDASRDFRFYDPEGRLLPYAVLDRHTDIEHVYPYGKLIQFHSKMVYEVALPLHIPAFSYETVTFDCINPYVGLKATDYCVENFVPPYQNQTRMRISPDSFDNGVLQVRVNSNGTLRICDKATQRIYDQALTFEDCGDVGEGWNYYAPMFDSQIYSTQSLSRMEVLADTALCARFRVTATMMIPIDATGERRNPLTREMTVQTTVTLRQGSYQMEFETEVENSSTNHRLRVLFPSFLDCDGFYTRTPYAMTHWNIIQRREHYDKEIETFVNPSQGITYVGNAEGSLTLSSIGLYEVEVTDDPSRTLCLTLFRSFTNEVGRVVPTDMGKKLGKSSYQFCLNVDQAKNAVQAYQLGQKYRIALDCQSEPCHAGALPACGTFLTVNNPNLDVVCFNRLDDCYELRLVNLSGEPQRAEIETAKPIRRLDRTNLNLEILEENVDAAVLKPYEVGTYLLTL